MDRLEVKFAPEDVAATGTFKGYGAVFGNIDSHGDIIVPGAFKATLAAWEQRNRLPPMRLMHGSNGNIFNGDDLPVGKWTVMREDAKGLYVEGKLSALDTDRGRMIHSLMKDDVLSGLSIGFRAKKFAKAEAGSPARRKLEEIQLVELSLVDEPSNELARAMGIKSAGDIKTIRQFEEFLRDAGGFSHTAAKAIATRGFTPSEPRDEDGSDIADALRRNIERLANRGA